MPTPDENNPTRRMITRRARGAGFASGSSSRAESLRAPAEDIADEVEDAIDPDMVQDRIVQSTRSVAAPAPVPDDGGMPDARARLNQVAVAGSSNYAKEYRLQLLNRLLQRRVPLDQIAQQLQVSISTVEKDRAELKRRLREAAKELNINEIIGTQQELYDEISGMALRVASSNETPTPMKLAAMRTSLAANADRTRFLASAGVFDVLRYRRSEDGDGMTDIELLMERTNEMLANLAAVPEAPSAPARPSRRRAPEGFQPFSMADADASGSGNEVQDL